MNLKIDQLVRNAALLSLPVPPLPPQRQERIMRMTMKQIKNSPTPSRHHKLCTILIAAALATALLCGTALAAYELFDFSKLFGDQAKLLEEGTVSYTPSQEEVPTAYNGLSQENHVSVDDYNFTLIGDATASDTLLYVTVDVSRVSQDVPFFTELDLQLIIEGYETTSFLRSAGAYERIVLWSELDAPLSDEDTLTIKMTGNNENAVILENIPITYTPANTAVFDQENPEADYVLERAELTETTLTVTGHFQKEFNGYDKALDASGTIAFGNIPWPLLDQSLTSYNPNDGNYHEDLEGYLVTREVDETGNFVLSWTFIKEVPQEIGATITFGGETYIIPAQELQETESIETIAPNLSNTAETQDYRFTLESMTASSDCLYAIVIMEPITEYGGEHMVLDSQDLTIVCGSGGTSGSIFIESDEVQSRYLVYSLGGPDGGYQVGDEISFQILNIQEDGDTSQHSYALFQIAIDKLVTESASAHCISASDESFVSYTDVIVSPMTLRLEGTYAQSSDDSIFMAADRAGAHPEIILNFSDGNSYTIMDPEWHPDPDNTSFGQYGVASVNTDIDSISEYAGTVTQTFMFTQLVSLDELETIVIDGAVYQVEH